ncbi:hypothetical protein CRENBAI_002678 [Crenichthys baileyi]|uniref:Uncharacterized protein n=1 Tax=Crenichthys baileyi TaxID=28760 RepID=A0AAV9SFX2_9TELE
MQVGSKSSSIYGREAQGEKQVTKPPLPNQPIRRSVINLRLSALPKGTSTCGRRKLELNPQPSDCKTTTLPTEPQPPLSLPVYQAATTMPTHQARDIQNAPPQLPQAECLAPHHPPPYLSYQPLLHNHSTINAQPQHPGAKVRTY